MPSPPCYGQPPQNFEPTESTVELDQENLDLTAHSIFSEVLSPFCPGRALLDCPSGSASELKNKIREELRAGKNKDQIMNELYTLYGDEISSVPRLRGFGLLAWLGPLVFFILGILIVIVWLRASLAQDPNH